MEIMVHTLNSQQTLNTLPSIRTSLSLSRWRKYGVCIVSILEKNEHAIKAPHRILEKSNQAKK